MLRRKPRTCTTWALAGSILPNEAPVDAHVRDLFEKTGLTRTAGDISTLSRNPIRVSLLVG
jgi:ADP-ribose pyrophosphatase YjhB (NUDIX family)